jgi:hypothetical protein
MTGATAFIAADLDLHAWLGISPVLLAAAQVHRARALRVRRDQLLRRPRVIGSLQPVIVRPPHGANLRCR